MKVLLSVSRTASIEVESDAQTDVFEGLADGQEVFGHDMCGCCQNEELRFLVRTNKNDDKFYEMACMNYKCRARLAFGCNKKGKGLYPKRRWDALSPSEQVNRAHQESDCRSGYLPNNGWYVFKREDAPRQEESHDAPDPSKKPF